MPDRTPFVLLDDARAEGAADAHLYQNPAEVFVARRAGEVEATLAAADAARVERGGWLAGFIAYEAGLALEPRLRELAETRTGAGSGSCSASTGSTGSIESIGRDCATPSAPSMGTGTSPLSGHGWQTM